MVKKLTFEDVHTCPQSRNKIIAIETDLLGNSKCGYCHNVVQMGPLIKQMMEELPEDIKARLPTEDQIEYSRLLHEVQVYKKLNKIGVIE